MNNLDLKNILPIFEQYGIEYAGLFGSYARGEEREDSDIDILVRLGRRMGLPKFIRLEKELAKTLGKKVDLISERGLKPHMKGAVMKDVKYIYGQR